MLKILVVNDKPLVLEGIAELLRGNENWDVLTAPGGVQALAVMDRQRPDIVLSGIQMPGMDGIRLLEEIQARWPFCKTIFLTAYKEFELARTAITKGAFGYLLKSDGDDAILRELRRCEEQINAEMVSSVGRDESRRRLKSAGPLLQNAALLNILEWMPYETAKRELAAYGLNLNLDAPMMLVAASIDNFPPDSNSHQRFLSMVEVEAIFIQYLSKRFHCYRASNSDKKMIWILQEQSEMGNPLLYCRQSLETVQRAAQNALGLSISIVYDDLIDFGQLHSHYRQLLSILDQIFVQGDGQVLADSKFYMGRHGNLPAGEPGGYAQSMEAIRQSLAAGDHARFAAALELLLYSRENNTAVRKLKTYHLVCSIVLEYIENIGLDEEVLTKPDHFSSFRVYNGRNPFLQVLTNLSEEIITKVRQLQTSRSDMLIQSIQNHINANLAGELSLQTVADAFYVNPAYLSRLYKQHTGLTIGEEITARRMDLAKRMLPRSEYRISEIARATGYESAAYFTRVFKKREGVTPQEWRAQRK